MRRPLGPAARRLSRPAGDERGFTLVELLVTVAVMGVVLGAFVTLFSGMLRTTTEVNAESNLQTTTRALLDRMSQELRQAYSGSITTPAISTMTATDIVFLSPDMATDYHERQIEYKLTGSTLCRAAVSSTDTFSNDGPPWNFPSTPSCLTVLDHVVNGATAVFAYYDQFGNVTANAANVATVGVTLQVSPDTAQGRQWPYSTMITLRNPQ